MSDSPHRVFDSGVIDDTPEAILAEVEKYCAMIERDKYHAVWIREPLWIERQRDILYRRNVAHVFARWTRLEPAMLRQMIDNQLIASSPTVRADD